MKYKLHGYLEPVEEENTIPKKVKKVKVKTQRLNEDTIIKLRTLSNFFSENETTFDGMLNQLIEDYTNEVLTDTRKDMFKYMLKNQGIE